LLLEPNDASFVDPVYQSLKAAAEARRNPTFELSQDNETSNKQMAPIISHEKSSVNQIKSRSNASSSGSSPSYLLSVKTPLHASSGIFNYSCNIAYYIIELILRKKILLYRDLK
jgi:hypothetical protein